LEVIRVQGLHDTGLIKACIPHQSRDIFAEIRVFQDFFQFLESVPSIGNDHRTDQIRRAEGPKPPGHQSTIGNIDMWAVVG
jgi:hypothetical protein